jgi:hypothetical protein
MPRLDVCDPSDCRVAFISRGQPQGVASVAVAERRRKCSPVVALAVLITDNQQAVTQTVDGENQRVRWLAYMRSTGLV